MKNVGKSKTDKCLVVGCDNLAYSRGVCQKHYQHYNSGYDKTIPILEPHSNKPTIDTPKNKKYCRKHYGYLNDYSIQFEKEEDCTYPGCRDSYQSIITTNLVTKDAEIKIISERSQWKVTVDFGNKIFGLLLHNGIRTEREASKVGMNWGKSISSLGPDNVNNLNFDRPYVTELKKNCKKRAKDGCGLCTISIYDIILPKYCPILKIELYRTTRDSGTGNSPSVDKIVPEKWYIPGNIQVLSWRANLAKSNLNFEEMKLMADYFYNLTK